MPSAYHTVCPHYERWMHSVHPATGAVVPCARCVADEDPTFDRFSVSQMVCAFCACAQPLADACANPECTARGRRHRCFCAQCRLWQHDPYADVFHCDACGMCRVGHRCQYRHCEDCGMCVPTRYHPQTETTADAHCCTGGRATDNTCPVCYEGLAASYDPVVFLRCGHGVHHTCLTEWWRHGGVAAMLGGCPLCRG